MKKKNSVRLVIKFDIKSNRFYRYYLWEHVSYFPNWTCVYQECLLRILSEAFCDCDPPMPAGAKLNDKYMLYTVHCTVYRHPSIAKSVEKCFFLFCALCTKNHDIYNNCIAG